MREPATVANVVGTSAIHACKPGGDILREAAL
jgi:hypothetical protein